MSFLGDIVNSIGSEKAPAPPKPPVRPISTNSHRSPADGKLGSRSGLPAAPSPLNGVKRKAEDQSTKLAGKHIRPNPTPGLTSSVARRPAAPPLNAPKASNGKEAPVSRPKIDAAISAIKAGSTPPGTPISATAKVPAKGSYADIMARAKQAQEARMQSQVGMIKHQATNREKVSKVAERRRQEEEKAKAAKAKPGERPLMTKRDMSRSLSPAKKGDQPRVAKAPRPPLHAPAASYKGTMGLTSNRSQKQAQRKRNKYDEYLATDEEDNSDEGSDGVDEEENYASDVSSDMEAGAFELDEEETKALRAAKEEDARELALENSLKKEKEERKKRLLAMANKRK